MSRMRRLGLRLRRFVLRGEVDEMKSTARAAGACCAGCMFKRSYHVRCDLIEAITAELDA